MIDKLIFENIPKLSANKAYAPHWGVRAGAKKKFADAINAQIKNFDTDIPIPYMVRELHFEFYWKSHPLDSTNCFPMIKMIEDIIMVEDNIDNVQRISVASNKSPKDKPMDWVVVEIIWEMPF